MSQICEHLVQFEVFPLVRRCFTLLQFETLQLLSAAVSCRHKLTNINKYWFSISSWSNLRYIHQNYILCILEFHSNTAQEIILYTSSDSTCFCNGQFKNPVSRLKWNPNLKQSHKEQDYVRIWIKICEEQSKAMVNDRAI